MTGLVPVPAEQIEELVSDIGEKLVYWFAQAWEDKQLCDPEDGPPPSAHAFAIASGLALFACIEAGRALQQSETRGMAEACSVDVEVK